MLGLESCIKRKTDGRSQYGLCVQILGVRGELFVVADEKINNPG